MAIITDIELAAAMQLGDGVSTLSEPISSIVTRLNAVGQAYVQLYIPMAADPIKNECIVRFASYLYDAPSASADGRFAAAWYNSGAAALAAPFMSLSVSGTAELAGGPGQPGMGVDQAAVNALISAAVYSWAQSTNTDRIPRSKLPSDLVTPSNGNGVDVNAAALARILNLERFESGIERTIQLLNRVESTVTLSRVPYRLGTAWPANDTEHHRITIDISNRQNNSLTHLGNYETSLALIYQRAQIDRAAVTQMTASNSYQFTLGDITFYVGRDKTDNILFSSDDIDTYTITISLQELDIEDFARQTSKERVPLLKLPDIPATKVTGLPSGGLTTSQVQALILAWARAGNADLIPVAKIPDLPSTKITGLTGGDLNAAALARITALETFRNSLDTTTTTTTTIANNASVRINFANEAEQLTPNATWPADTGATITVSISTAAGVKITDFETTIAAIFALDGYTPGSDLGGRVAVAVRHVHAGVTYYATHAAGGRQGRSVLIGSSTAASYRVTITASTTATELDIEAFARLSMTDLVPVAKIPDLPSTKITGLPAAGLSTAQVRALILDWAEQGNTSLIPVAKIPNLPSTKITGLPSGGGGLSTAQVQALIVDWAEQGNTSLIPVAKIPNLPSTKITGLPSGGGGGLSTQDADTLRALENTQDGLTVSTSLVNAAVNVATANTGVQLVLTGNAAFPASTGTTDLRRVEVNIENDSPVKYRGRMEFGLNDFVAKPKATVGSTVTDAMGFNATLDGTKFKVALATDGAVVVTSDTTGTYNFSINTFTPSIDAFIQPKARASFPGATDFGASFLRYIGAITITASNSAANRTNTINLTDSNRPPDFTMLLIFLNENNPAVNGRAIRNASIYTMNPGNGETSQFEGSVFCQAQAYLTNFYPNWIELSQNRSGFSMKLVNNSQTGNTLLRGRYLFYWFDIFS